MSKICYVVDVDGTICNDTGGNYELAKPILYRIEHFNKLFDQGHEVHYWTARGGRSGITWSDKTKRQLDEWGVKYTTFSTGKKPYDVLVDDRAFNADSYFSALSKSKIFVNGTFDILHVGHLSMLKYAKNLGTVTVAIDGDERVKKLKGPNRPINSERERKAMLLALKYVDHVVIFNTDEELRELVGQHDVMVKGADYKGKPIIGQDVCKELVFFDVVSGFSTTEKIKQIILNNFGLN